MELKKVKNTLKIKKQALTGETRGMGWKKLKKEEITTTETEEKTQTNKKTVKKSGFEKSVRRGARYVYECVVAGGGAIAHPSLNFGLSENLLCVGQFSLKNAQLEAENPHSGKKLGAKLKL